MYSCTFIGHRWCPDDTKKRLYDLIENLIINENVSIFYVGTHGRFDRFAYDALCKLEKIYDIKTIVVLAYLNTSEKDLYYDLNKTLFPSVLEKTPMRFAINKRNMYMIEKSQYMICYLENSLSNAYTFVKKAVDKKLYVKNLGEYDIHKIK